MRKGSEDFRSEYTLQEIHGCEIFGLLTKCLDQESMICLGEWRSLRYAIKRELVVRVCTGSLAHQP